MADDGKDSGSKLLLFGGIAVCLLLLMGGAGAWYLMHAAFETRAEKYAPTAPPEPEYKGEAALSEPADPWAEPAPPMQGVLLVFPFRNETGNMDGECLELQEQILWPWTVVAPPGIGVVGHERIQGQIPTMTRANAYWNPSSQVLDDAAIFWGATHVLEGTMRRTDASMIVDAKFSAPEGVREKTFEVPAGHDLVLVRDISAWMLDESGWTIPERENRVLRSKPYGEEFDSSSDDRMAAMGASPGAPEWKAALDANPENPLLPVWRALLISSTGNDGQLALLDRGPLAANAPPWEREIRALALMAKGEKRAARHEVEILLASRPGSMRQADFALNRVLKEEDDHRHRSDVATRWHERAPRSPCGDASLAEIYRRVAWQYRGTGWASTVSAEDWHFFGTFNGKALDLYERAIARGGPIPWVCDGAMIIHGSGGTDADMMRVLDLCAAKYPDHVSTWSTALNYLRPRWGGSHEEARALIDRALWSSDAWLMSTLGMLYCNAEANLEFKDVFWIDRMRAFCDKHPAFEEQLRRCAELAMERAPGEREPFAWAAGTAEALKDKEWLREIARRKPDLWRADREYFPNGWDAQTLWRLQFMLFDHSDWKEHRAMLEYTLGEDERRRSQKDGGKGLINAPNAPGVQYMLGFAETMTGDADKGFARMGATPPGANWHLLLGLAAQLIADRETQAACSGAEAMHAAAPNDPDANAVLALARWRQGNSDEALRLIETAERTRNSDSLDGLFPVIRGLIEKSPAE